MSGLRADFYLLESPHASASWQMACRLLEKAHQQKNQAFVLCPDQLTAEHVDEQLWTFREDSFIPHNLIGEGPSQPPPIQIGWEEPPSRHRDILVLLRDSLPANYTQFKRLLVIVRNDEAEKATARDMYKYLRENGVEINIHKL